MLAGRPPVFVPCSVFPALRLTATAFAKQGTRYEKFEQTRRWPCEYGPDGSNVFQANHHNSRFLSKAAVPPTRLSRSGAIQASLGSVLQLSPRQIQAHFR